MRKFMIMVALSVVTMFLVASAAFAIQSPYTHGNFGTNSKGCGDCHVTHSADVAKLLIGRDSASTQTQFCLSCHGFLSPFNVKAGIVMKQSAEPDPNLPISTRFTWNSGAVNSGNSNWSLAGGFATAGNFMVGSSGTANNTVYGTLSNVTSVHNVRGIQAAVGSISNVTTYDYVYDQTNATNKIPGGSSTLDFECSSCHDPHAGGLYPNGTKNPRLLKANIFSRTNMQVAMDIDQAENLPTKYVSGINNWCGSCHDIFDTSGVAVTSIPADPENHRTGYYLNIGGRTKYMHLFGIDVVDAAKWGGIGGTEDRNDPFKVEFLALSAADSKEITCMTCHRAHGSSAPATNEWTRYQAYNDYDGSGTNATGKGSALLRLPNRDVCYLCHGAATYNHSITHSTSTTE